jgi:dihydrofolate reductase
MTSSSIIVAMTPGRVIGRDGQLPWHLSADLRRFKRLTMGHHIIMGRKTYDSIGRLLPGRKTVVVTRQADLEIPGATVVHNIAEAIVASRDDSEAFFIGGEQIYREALAVADRIYLTLVEAQVAGDAFFPELPQHQWQLVDEESHTADEKNEFDFTFQLWQRQA